MHLFLKILKWSAIGIAVAFAALVVYRMFVLRDKEKTNEQVARIHTTKLTLDDVMGKNLPPSPGTEADKTIAGIDANKNGIRDDVELAIFKEYPSSAKTRAVLLQYALALQMEVIQTRVNSGTVGAIEEQKSRGYLCIGKIVSRDDMTKYIETTDKLREFIEIRQLNTDFRKKAQEEFYRNLKSGEIPNKDLCDIDINTLIN